MINRFTTHMEWFQQLRGQNTRFLYTLISFWTNQQISKILIIFRFTTKQKKLDETSKMCEAPTSDEFLISSARGASLRMGLFNMKPTYHYSQKTILSETGRENQLIFLKLVNMLVRVESIFSIRLVEL